MLRSISHLLVIAAIGLIAFLGFGCSHEENAPLAPAEVVTPPRDPESLTIENAQLVCDAVDAWIAGNDSLRFPTDLADRNENGKTIVDLLPDGQLLLNPYSEERSEPQSSKWPPEPGAIYYSMQGPEVYDSWGYGVYAYGSDGLLWEKEIRKVDRDEAERQHPRKSGNRVDCHRGLGTGERGNVSEMVLRTQPCRTYARGPTS